MRYLAAALAIAAATLPTAANAQQIIGKYQYTGPMDGLKWGMTASEIMKAVPEYSFTRYTPMHLSADRPGEFFDRVLLAVHDDIGLTSAMFFHRYATESEEQAEQQCLPHLSKLRTWFEKQHPYMMPDPTNARTGAFPWSVTDEVSFSKSKGIWDRSGANVAADCQLRSPRGASSLIVTHSQPAFMYGKKDR